MKILFFVFAALITLATILTAQTSLELNKEGMHKFNLKKYDEAIDLFTSAIKLNPDFKEAYANRGTAYFKNKDYSYAITDLNKAIELDTTDFENFNSRGIVFDAIKEYKKAISDYTKATDLNPKYATAYYNRSNTYLDLNDYTNAIADLTKAIDCKTDEMYLYYFFRGNAYYETDKRQEACKDWEKAYKLGGMGDARELLNEYCK